jgi:hypothetical protein
MTLWKALSVAVACCIGAAAARAQSTPVWTDIDCSQLRIPAAIGLKCRGLNLSGIASQETSAGGTFRQLIASGAINRVKLFYLLLETTSLQTGVSTRSTLAETMKQLIPQASNFSELRPRDGVDFVTFTGAAGDACIGVRRLGTAAIAGYKWLVVAFRCVAANTTVPDSDVTAFIAGTRPSS